MDDSAEESLSFEDDVLLQDDPFEDSCICVPDVTSEDYVRVTQLYYDGVGMQYKDYAQSEKNLEYDICNIWCSKPLSILQDYCDTIKLYIFWPLLFQHQHSSVISRLHPCVEAIRSRAAEISLKKLQHLELMEDIVDLAKKVANDSFLIEGLLRIGYKIENKILAMEEALNWIKYTGDVTILPKLGSVDSCWPMLSIFFTEYKYHITKVVTENCNLLEEFRRHSCMQCVKQGELMKMRGNDEFSKQKFELAVIYYTRAIEYRPENHLLYGNRALCFLRMGQFRNALSDGKRAIVLKNTWPKGHYRYCDALSMLGEYDWALQANIKAQKLCKNDPEGIKDLIQQHVKLQKQIEDLQGRTSNKNPIKAFYESRAYIPRNSSAPAFRTSLNFVETERGYRKTKYRMANGGHQNLKVADEALKGDDCDCHPEFLPPPSQPPKHKGKQKSRSNESEKPSSNAQATLPVDLKSILEKQFSKSSRAIHQDFANIMKMLRSLIQDGYTALLEQRCRSAAQAFTELLNGLDPQKIKQLNLAMINYVLVVYGLAVSLLGIGRPEELSEAENQFKRIIEYYPNEGLDCLAYCGIGKVYLKKNRFLEALNHFEKAKTLIYRLPGILTWPTSNVIIEESKPEKIQVMLEKFVEECKFPPVPDAVCCYPKCRGYSKIQIYLTDPDFKGFIRISCCQYCKVEFHINCWKKLKATTFNDKIDKDFLQGLCLTPDCEGIISKIIIFSSGGQVKCEFEHKVIKEKAPSRPVLKQKCSSLEKLRLKEEKKLKRKIQKQEAKKLAQERMQEDLKESNLPKIEEPEETVDTAQSCQFLDDRILQCIKQNADRIKAGVLNTSPLLKELLSWKVLSTEDYTACFSSKNFLREAVDYVIQHLVQEKSRVQTRIFLHVLSELKEVDPKLAPWIQRLNSFGLDATGPFFTRYGASLKELDFSVLTILWNEKYGHKLGSIEGKPLDFFCEPASATEARCLIWLLETHRDRFPALHSALDDFFDVMDSRCTILRKQDSDEMPFGCIKVKNKGKKKKPKDSKPMLVGSGAASVAASPDTATPEDQNRRNSDSAGPFAVPDHLRQDVEEFEALYDQHNSEYVVRNKKLWDINPKQKCSTLYDYFSQLLEEHGPLDMSDRMFSEEYEFFPEETRQILEKAGGLKSFLLGCPRFVVIDNCIALKKVASRLKKKRRKKNMKTKVEEMSKTGEYLRINLPLNPSAREFKPDVKSAAVPEDIQSAAGPAEESPQPAVKPQLDSDSSSGSASEDSRLEVASPDSATPLYEDAPPGPAASSPTPAAEDAKPAYWTQSRVLTGFCTYLPLQGFDITPSRPAYINMVPNLSQFAGIYTPLASISAEYPVQRSMPVMPSFASGDRADNSATAYFESRNLNTENDSGEQTASDTQMPESSLGMCAKPQDRPAGADSALSEPERNSSSGRGFDTAREASPAGVSGVARAPHTLAVGTQASRSVIHREVNTEPYEPFETQQGALSRVEKECCLLKERLKAACASCEQTERRSAEEPRDLEEKLRRHGEESKISKTELDWFLQDLDREIKKWQQEKKEIQERLKALKKKIKKIVNTSEMYAQKNDGLDKECESHLDQSLGISALTNEKMKVEECIKKGKERYEESRQRAVAAEVSVLENWKEREVCKLQGMASQAEAYLKNLKLMSSDSAASPEMECDTHSWESFLSNVREEMENTKSQFEDQIKAIKNGSRLSELSKVQISELSFPACMMIRPQFSSESSCHEDLGLLASGDSVPGAAHKDSDVEPAGGHTEELPELSSGSPTCWPECAQQLERKRASQVSPSEPGPEADEKPSGQAAWSNQSPNKPLHSIIEHLSVIFPSYASTELAGFIKKVRNRNKNSLSGLSTEEIVERVTEHILDEQKKKKPNPGKDKKPSEAHSAAAVARSSQSPPLAAAGLSSKTKGQKKDDSPAPEANSCEICHEMFRSKNMRVLKCGHKFHKGCFKQWLKGQSTCPTCGSGDLLSEE
ncbi:E3 ubiquitin-protein ligase TTC3 isoform X3 [Meriones unguiculatus]|uniref:E3 ubiquitin-protein ligase TTC3 isoform X3 n=1 Tax=Meriones unguiculatus TaxID=10047 RepID=UPI00293E4FBF|nr:E3 ubiquitin-protein ligase TTC3 isoform X3 [Meriones unguiculatus]